MSSTDTTDSVSAVDDDVPIYSKCSTLEADQLVFSNFMHLTINGFEYPFPVPLAGRAVNPLEVNHAVNVSLSNGVSDLVYIVVHASNERLALLDNFNECM